MSKRCILTLLFILPITSIFFTTQSTYAEKLPCDGFAGFTPITCDVNDQPANTNELKSNVWRIAANVAKNISVTAAYLVIGYVIYGGYLYMLSSGDPGKVASGKKTLTRAFIGLAITMLANAIVDTIRIAFIGQNSFSNCAIEGSGTCSTNIIVNSIHWFIAVAGFVAVIFVVYGGISYITSSGDPNKLQRAKNSIQYALIGLAIVALAEIITSFVANAIRDANKSAINNQTAISKEINHEIR